MKQSLCLLFVLVCSMGIYAAPSSESSVIHKGKCLIGDVWISDGERTPAPVGSCTMLECYVDKDTGVQSLGGSGCGAYINTNPKCVVVEEDNTKQFPACCEHYECADQDDEDCTEEMCV